MSAARIVASWGLSRREKGNAVRDDTGASARETKRRLGIRFSGRPMGKLRARTGRTWSWFRPGS